MKTAVRADFQSWRELTPEEQETIRKRMLQTGAQLVRAWDAEKLIYTHIKTP